MNLLASSGNKNISLPSSFWSWRNCPRRSGKSKRIGPTPHPYGPVSQPSGVRGVLFKREDIKGTRHRTPCGFICMAMERIWESGMNPSLTLEAQICDLQGKTITNGGFSRKIALLVSSGQLSRQNRRLILLLILWKEFVILICNYEKWVMKSKTWTRRALPPARWRKETTGLIGLCGFNGAAHQTPRSIRL